MVDTPFLSPWLVCRDFQNSLVFIFPCRNLELHVVEFDYRRLYGLSHDA